MKSRIVPLAVLVAALAGIGTTIAWAVARGTDGGHVYGQEYGSGYSMMAPGGQQLAWYVDGSSEPARDIASARARAQRFAERLDLRTAEVMRFANDFYVLLEDRQGKPATEVLVDPQTGVVTLEYGPAMMWNTRYTMMGDAATGMMGSSGGAYGSMMGSDGMMGRYGGSPSWTPPRGTVSGPLTVGEAQRVANQWLATQGNGQTAADPDALPGYFTFHTLKNGKITGMLSVNEQTGAVWYHWWHGRFVAMEE